MVVGDRIQTMSDPIYWSSTVFQKDPHTLLDFYIGFAPSGNHGSLLNTTPVLSECLFQWCVKTFEASHQDGRFVKRVLSTYLPPDVTGNPPNPVFTIVPASTPNDPFVMIAGGKEFGVGAKMRTRAYYMA
jgi:hypothetical protein